MSESVNGTSSTSSLQLLSERWEGMRLPPNLKLLLSWPSDGRKFLHEARGLPGHSRAMSMEGLSMGGFRRRQYSSSSEGIVSCESPISSIGKSPMVAERPVVEVESPGRRWAAQGRAEHPWCYRGSCILSRGPKYFCFIVNWWTF